MEKVKKMALLTHLTTISHFFGLTSVYQTGPNAWLIILSRSTRMFAYGAISLILAIFFSSLNFSDFQIGLFMTLTLLGDLLLSFFLTLIADGIGRRRVLFLGSVMMALSGATFALFDNFWILLGAAVIGVVSATGSDFGPFRAIEESMLSQLTEGRERNDVLAWYVTGASLGSALGTEVCGRVVDALAKVEGWRQTDAYHAVFWVYVVMGGLNILFVSLLGAECEIGGGVEKRDEVGEGDLEREQAEMLIDGEDSDAASITSSTNHHLSSSATSASQSPTASSPSGTKSKSIFASISRPTLSIMIKLWFLLCIDSLADGMVGYSLTTYFLSLKFTLSKSALGDIISTSYLLSSISTIFASPLANRLGLINTMVFTHLPSSIAVLLFPFPNAVGLTIALFFVRTALNNMDQAPRSAFIAAVVRDEERTAVMGITSMLRTLAATAGPSVTGVLAGSDRFWIAFVAAGSLRVIYDLGLWGMFINMRIGKGTEGEGRGKERGPIGDGDGVGDEERGVGEELRTLRP